MDGSAHEAASLNEHQCARGGNDYTAESLYLVGVDCGTRVPLSRRWNSEAARAGTSPRVPRKQAAEVRAGATIAAGSGLSGRAKT